MKMRLFLNAIALVLVAASGCARLDPHAVYFLVSEISVEHGDSFILPITDPDDIAYARAIIADPNQEGPRIVVAQVEKCNACTGLNRDLLNDGKRWSWCVTEFTGFADITAEIYDGWPTYVEENYDEWYETTQGGIGFWSYTVTRELDPVEVLTGRLKDE
ncbi:MAG TPA: hypothetical protein PLJ47_03950 [Candidatus Hydrogenedentes bacterium]|nr:hypothetical protein [Candidatus Hydrogenedentota bacterium]